MLFPTLPKAELHCHLDGCLSRAMLADILISQPDYPIRPQSFAQAYPVDTFDTFIAWWSYLKPLEGRLESFSPILHRHIEKLKKQNVRYAEIIIAAGEFPDDPVLAVEKMTALRQQANQQENGSIQVEFLVGHGRNRAPTVFRQRAERSLALWRAGLIVGVAIAGVEPGWPIQTHADTMSLIHDAGMHIEAHAGEWCGPESVWDALEYGFPERIGHGVHLFEDPRLIEIFQERQIHLEFCPTSNLRTGSITRLEDHPLRRALSLELNFSLNTDDPGPFEISLDDEYQLAAERFGFTQADFTRMYQNSLAARFQPTLHVEI